ncbi:MAG: tetratricopeptide repeat protein [Isosphaeraceae bacterium]|nr:tetratricopeptide repeat protein [Isosphaeraceae bacterium]
MSSGSDKHQKAKIFFETGNDAALKGNFDYAIQMYQEACKLHPDNLMYRQALRGVVRRKFGGDPKKVGMMSGPKNQSIRMKARSAKGKGNFDEALALCEQAFVNNPWDIGAARDAAEAAEGAGYLVVAAWLVESVLPMANDVDFFRFAGHIYEINEDWPKAINCWERVKKINQYDEDASRQINALSAKATIKRSGLGEAINKQPEGGSGPEKHQPDLEELKQEKLPPEVRLKREIQEHPDRVTSWLALADIFRSRSQLEEAQKLLAEGLKANPRDPNLTEVLAEVQMARLDRAITQYKQQSLERPHDTAIKGKLAQIVEKRNEYELMEAQRKAQLHPEDFQIQFNLGMVLQKLGKNKEAIGAFQMASSGPSLRVKALYQTGLCFEADGLLKLAERKYQDALKALEEGDVENLKAIHYQLGRVAEAQGNGSVAEEHYNEVAAIDFSYKDVAERLRNLS